MLWISATVALICEKIGKNPERTTKVKSFISETFYNWEGIKYQLQKDGWRKFEKMIQQLMCYIKNKWSFVLPTFQDTIQVVKNELFF